MKAMIHKLCFAALLGTVFFISNGLAIAEPKREVVPASKVSLQPLNPLRGDLSPKAGVLWGDIKRDIPTGTLIEFVDGFSSPPHIHNITYRGVVISGEVHNDDPGATTLWMGPGSFWTQPAGETHITSAKPGNRAIAFLEILEGPYLVRPAAEEFDTGERPITMEARNIIWLDASSVSWVNLNQTQNAQHDAEIAFLWGQPVAGEKNGTFLKLASGFDGRLTGGEDWLRAVVISGALDHQPDKDGQSSESSLGAGSFFGSTESAGHEIACISQIECILYVSTTGRYQLTRNE